MYPALKNETSWKTVEKNVDKWWCASILTSENSTEPAVAAEVIPPFAEIQIQNVRKMPFPLYNVQLCITLLRNPENATELTTEFR